MRVRTIAAQGPEGPPEYNKGTRVLSTGPPSRFFVIDTPPKKKGQAKKQDMGTWRKGRGRDAYLMESKLARPDRAAGDLEWAEGKLCETQVAHVMADHNEGKARYRKLCGPGTMQNPRAPARDPGQPALVGPLASKAGSATAAGPGPA